MKISFKNKFVKITSVLLALIMAMSSAMALISCKDKNKDSETEEEKPAEIPDFDYMGEDLTKYVTLGQYKGLKIKIPKIPEITEGDVEKQIEVDLIASKLFEKITDRKVLESDTISIQYKGYMDGKEFEGGSGTKDMFTVFNGGGFIDGFAKGLIGAEVGKEVSLNLTFPKDYGHKDLAGKPVVFKVTVDYIYGASKLTDEVAKKLTGDETMDVAKLKVVYREKMEKRVEKQHKDIKINLVWTEIFKNAKRITLPEELVQGYYKVEQQYYESLGKIYGFTYEKVLELLKITEKEIMEEVKENLYADMIFYSIVKAENIVLTDEDYEKYLNDYIETSGKTKDEILKTYTKEELSDMFLSTKGYEAATAWQEYEYVESGVEVPEPDFDYMGKDLTKYVTLGQYKGLLVKVEEVRKLTDEMVKEQIDRELMANGFVDKITDRKVLRSDVVGIEYEGYMDGKKFEGGSGSKDFFTIFDGGGFIPGFADGLVDAEIGKEVTLELKFPDNYRPDLANKDVTFKVTVKHIYIPKPLTDELVKQITKEDDMTVEKFTEKYRKNIQDKIDAKYEEVKQKAVWDAIVDASKEVELPADLVEQFYKYDVQYYKRTAAQMGVSYEALMKELKLTDEILKERAHYNVLFDMVVFSVIKAENLTLNDEEFEAHLEKVCKETGMSKETLLTKYSKDELRKKFLYEIIYEKAITWQTIEYVPIKDAESK